MLLSSTAVAGVFTIGSYSINEYNVARTGEVVEGPTNLKVYRNDEFTKRAVLDIVKDEETGSEVKQFRYFDRTRTVGHLLGHPNDKGIATYVSFPEKATAPPSPNIDSSTIEFTWGHSDLRNISAEDGGPDLYNKLKGERGSMLREELLAQPSYNPGVVGRDGASTEPGVRPATVGGGSRQQADAGPQESRRYRIGWGVENKPGPDLVVYESGTYEGFTVALRKKGDEHYSYPRYQFAKQFDTVHNVNAVAYEFSDFGFKEGDVIVSIRLRNIFNAESRHGADRVDDPSGEGRVLYPGDAGYENGFPLLKDFGGKEFKVGELDADITYIVALQDLVPVQEE